MISRLKHMFRLRSRRLSTKLITVYFLLSVVPMSLIGIISYIQYTKSIEEQIGEYMPRFLIQANENISKYMDEFTELPSLLFNSDNLIAILRKDDYENQSDLNNDLYTVNNYLARTYLNSGNPDVLGVFVLSHERLFHSSRLKFSGLDGEDDQLLLDEDQNYWGKAKMVLPSEISLRFEDDEPFIVVVKQINDVDNRRSLGTMLIAVKLSFIDNILRSFEKNDHADLWLMTKQGELIYHTDREKIGQTDGELPRYPILNGSFRKGSGNNAVIYSLNESVRYDWILAHSIPLKYLTERTDLIKNVTIFLFIVFTFITATISVVFALNVSRPIKKLSRLMKDVEMGKLQVDLPVNSQDEIGTLARSFNSMIATIRELIENNYDIRIRQKEAELYALQSQINPHFMYNTLETISMAVEEGKSDQVVDMVTLLGRMLRFSVGNKSKYVTITEEIQHIGNYLTIQQFRFKERLQFDIDIKAPVDHLYTPKFILQPVVENAVKYGMESRKALQIEISVSREFGARSGEDDIVFRVRDNGPGIHPDRQEKLEQSLRLESLMNKDSEFGLSNVNARIHIMLGKEYGLQFHSIYGKGTEVTIRIPPIVKPADVPERSRQRGERHEDDTHDRS